MSVDSFVKARFHFTTLKVNEDRRKFIGLNSRDNTIKIRKQEFD